MTSQQAADAIGVSRMTLYSMNRKEGGVSFATVQAVCRLLGISLAEYERLDRCPMAAQFKEEGEEPHA